MNARPIVSAALIAGLGAMFACGDSSTMLGPKTSPVSAERATAADGHGRHVRVLRWNDALNRDVKASAVIGPRGGTLSLRGLNTVFTVPAGALTAPTTITVTALAGRRVVFTMTPHGTQFAKPAILTMSLKNTNAFHKQAWRTLLEAGYIESPIQIGTDDGVNTYEDIATTVDAAVTTASFPMSHFSVVILASQIGDPVPCVTCNTPHGADNR
jgi:hypothetical protein